MDLRVPSHVWFGPLWDSLVEVRPGWRGRSSNIPWIHRTVGVLRDRLQPTALLVGRHLPNRWGKLSQEIL